MCVCKYKDFFFRVFPFDLPSESITPCATCERHKMLTRPRLLQGSSSKRSVTTLRGGTLGYAEIVAVKVGTNFHIGFTFLCWCFLVFFRRYVFFHSFADFFLFSFYIILIIRIIIIAVDTVNYTFTLRRIAATAMLCEDFYYFTCALFVMLVCVIIFSFLLLALTVYSYTIQRGKETDFHVYTCKKVIFL